MHEEKAFQGVREPITPWPPEQVTRPPVPPATSERMAFGLAGTSAVMTRLRAMIRCFAPYSATVVIRGETGTGKELVARALHTLSGRRDAPFVAANAATFSQQLVASELFGHERGAFTGAVARHRGVFEQADRGTLFIDELGELDLAVQTQLLRVLETGEVRPLGTERTRRVQVRLVVATHRDLEGMLGKGTMRADLYHRLHVLTIDVPPLRARAEDIPVLVEVLLSRLAPEVGVRRLTADALDVLARQAWPGNVRELQNVLRRAAILSDLPVLNASAVEDVLCQRPPREPEVSRRPPPDAETLRDALAASRGSISAASRRLGIARSTLRGYLQQAGLRPNG